MKKTTILFLITLITAILSCNVLDPESENDLDPIDSRIIFSITYDSTHILYNHTGFLLLLKTEKIYSCSNYEIVSELSIETPKLNVRVFGIDRGEMCATALGPATILLPLEISDGDYSLEINLMSETDNYSLQIDNFSVNVDSIKSDFTRYHEYNFDF